jgi:hypothetical protein
MALADKTANLQPSLPPKAAESQIFRQKVGRRTAMQGSPTQQRHIAGVAKAIHERDQITRKRQF